MRGRREKELEPLVPSEGGLGVTIRAWRRFHGLTVTDLATQAGFGKNGRGYISKIEHQQIKRLGDEQIASIAQALRLTPTDLQQGRLPETQDSPLPDKDTLDDAILGCTALLRVYHQDDKPLDRARTSFKLAELCWERFSLTKERDQFLHDALQSLDQALPIFRKQAPGSYAEAQYLHTLIKQEVHKQNLDDAIAGCNALLKVHRQEEKPLDWARTHTRLAQLYWDRATQSEKTEDQHNLLGKALHSLDQALPIFQTHAPVSYTQTQRMRSDLEDAKETVHSTS